MYESECQQIRTKLEEESKQREESEVEVLDLQRKVKLLEGNIERKEDRLQEVTRQLKDTSEHLQNSDDRRQTIETTFGTTGDRTDALELQVAEAKKIAEESDQKCEEIVRKLMLSEHQKDRAEDRASRNDSKIKGLQTELNELQRTVGSLTGNEEKSGQREDDTESQIKVLKERFMDAESRAETAERAVQKLQKEVDSMESGMLVEKTKRKKMEEDMDSLMQSIADI